MGSRPLPEVPTSAGVELDSHFMCGVCVGVWAYQGCGFWGMAMGSCSLQGFNSIRIEIKLGVVWRNVVVGLPEWELAGWTFLSEALESEGMCVLVHCASGRWLLVMSLS